RHRSRDDSPERPRARDHTPERPERHQPADPTPEPAPSTRSRDDSPEPPRAPDDSPEPPRISHAHSHSHEPPPPASDRLRKILAALLAPFVLAALAGTVALWPSGDLPDSTIDSGRPIGATVTAVAAGSCTKPGEVNVADTPDDKGPQRCLTLTLRLTEGEAAGTTLRKLIPIQPTTPPLAAGGDPTTPDAYQVKDFQRGLPLLLLAALFALAVVALGRWQGLRALIGLIFTFGALALFVLPAILDGRDPLLVAITAAGLIMFAT